MDGIGRMLDGCGTGNRNDLGMVGIEALIDGGGQTGPNIVRAAAALGVDAGHAGVVVSANRGSNPDRPRRQRGVDGVCYLQSVKLAA